jgi:hypothetical protein
MCSKLNFYNKLVSHLCAGHGSQCCDVVLVKGRINLEKPQGVGISEWETDGEQMGRDGNEGTSLQATWDQGGRILSQQGGFQVSKGVKKGEQKGLQQGEKNKGKSATCINPKCVHNDCV